MEAIDPSFSVLAPKMDSTGDLRLRRHAVSGLVRIAMDIMDIEVSQGDIGIGRYHIRRAIAVCLDKDTAPIVLFFGTDGDFQILYDDVRTVPEIDDTFSYLVFRREDRHVPFSVAGYHDRMILCSMDID